MVLCFFIKTDRRIFWVSKQLGGIMAGRLSFLLLILAFLLQTCSSYPSAPQYSGIGDCGKPTIPANIHFKDSVQYWTSSTGAPESTIQHQTYSCFEIYNYEKDLIYISSSIGFSQLVPAPWRTSSTQGGYDIYWDGRDMNGKKVDNGTYITKLTLATSSDTFSSCGTLLLTTN